MRNVSVSFYSGLILIIMGLIFNKWFIEAAIVPDGNIEGGGTVGAIVAIQVAAVVIGAYWVIRRPSITQRSVNWSEEGYTLNKRVAFSLIVAVLAFLAAGFIGEMGIRLVGRVDNNNNFWVGALKTKPYHVPVAGLEKAIDDYLSNDPVAHQYDSVLGWSTMPNGESKDGLFQYNSAGIRSPREYSASPQEGVLRIALFGDSFTWGDEVPFENTWGYQLETSLASAGIDAEVLNFGVGGYGMDQAFLRWDALGQKYAPNIVIFGFQAENTARNVNLFRRFYFGSSGVIFTKPRFVLESNQLRLINVPTIEPSQVPQLVANFGMWDLADYEYFYQPRDYEDRIWLKSKLVSASLALATARRDIQNEIYRREFYSLDNEPGKLAFTIVQEFEKDVEANSGEFFILHLPPESALRPIASGNEPVYSELLQELMRSNTVIDPTDALVSQVDESSLGELFMPNGHPSEKGNRVIGEVAARFLIERQNR